MKKGFIQASKLIILLVCASALFLTGINALSASPVDSVKAATGIGIEYCYEYTGEIQPVTLQPGVYNFELWGANGGYRTTAALGGIGGYSKGTLIFDTPTIVYLGIGGFGGLSNTSVGTTTLGTAGYNGGGKRHGYTGGGGATHIAINENRGVLSSYVDNKNDILFVAGGGGSVGAANKPGANGGGADGASTTQSWGSGGHGGTQTAGGLGNTSQPLTAGAFGQGGQGFWYANGFAGAGGGGWYGGAGSYPDGSGDDDRGGGGGSGYVSVNHGITSILTVQATAQGFVPNPDTSGNGYIRIFRECTNYTFNSEGQEFLSINLGVEETSLTIPAEIPTKTGYVFAGWTDGAVTYQPGENYPNPTNINVVFDATFEIAVYDVAIIDNQYLPELHENGSEVTVEADKTIKIGKTGMELTTSHTWGEYLRWMVKVAGATGNNIQDWVEFGAAQAVALNLEDGNANSMEFIRNCVDYYTDSTGATVGKLTFKIANINDTYIIDLNTNLTGAGTFKIGIDGENPVTISFGNKISLPKQGRVTSISAVANPHYQFVSFEIYDAGDNLKATITEADYITSIDDPLFALDGSGLVTNYEIKVNFVKIEYAFNIIAAVNGQENNPIDGLLSNITPTPISINETAEFSATASSGNNHYAFIEWKMYDHINEAYVYQTNGLLAFENSYTSQEINSAWLARYVKNGVVTVVAEYIELYHIQVNFAEGQESFGSLIVKVTDGLTGVETQYNFVDLFICKGSTVAIQTRPYELYEFDKFTNVLASELGSSALSAEIQINEDRSIEAVFKPRAFEIKFNAKHGKNTLSNPATYSTIKNNQNNTGNTFSVNDFLNSVAASADVPGYRFINFSIIAGDDSTITDLSDILITEEILHKNLNRLNQFIITVNYVKLYTLGINVAEDSIGMGTYEVYIEGETSPTALREFAIGTKLIIKAVSNSEYYEFDCFTGFSPSENAASTIATEREIELFEKKGITVYFKTKPLPAIISDLSESGKGDSSITGTENLKIGNSIVITASPKAGQEIKSWKINGINIKELAANNAYNVNISDTAVTITLNAAWLDDFRYDIVSEVEFGMFSATMTIITVISITVPLLLIIFLIYFINLRKKISVIKKELQEEYKTKQKYGTSELLKNLREGKDIGVTDETIKKAMKEKKKKD